MKKLALILLILTLPANAGTLSAEGGRYVFGQVSKNRTDQFVLDTQTGRLWQLQKGQRIINLDPIYYDVQGKPAASPDSEPIKKKN